jgi:TorA maturation chaperone TorD
MAVDTDKPDKIQLAPVRDDLCLLARIHDRELDAEFLSGLRKEKLANLLSVSLESDNGVLAVKAFDQALSNLPTELGDQALDALAAEFANIYLCHNYRIAPTGSVWLTEERLERQEPMFAVRDWYAKYEVSVPNWRIRPDDHITHELQFLANLCEIGTEQSSVDAVAFMDECMLAWIPEFSGMVEERAKEDIYIAAAVLTCAYLEELRDLLEAITGISRPILEEANTPEARQATARLYDIDQDRPFVPGVSESW